MLGRNDDLVEVASVFGSTVTKPTMSPSRSASDDLRDRH